MYKLWHVLYALLMGFLLTLLIVSIIYRLFVIHGMVCFMPRPAMHFYWISAMVQ
jgi:hypothetical protein